jgi:microcin C transport system permease protein
MRVRKHERRVKSYFLRRFLLIFPTMLGITLLIFTITRFVPGGPLDRMLQQAAEAQKGSRANSGNSAQSGLSEEQLEELEEQFGLDKPTLFAYGQWLGVVPREVKISKGEYGARTDEMIGGELDADKIALVVLRGDGRLVHAKTGRSLPPFSPKAASR